MPRCLLASRRTSCGTVQRVGGLHARPGQADGELLLALGLARKLQRDDAARVGLQLRPMTQRRAADGLDVEARGQQSSTGKFPRA